jgi:hypothetical protein
MASHLRRRHSPQDITVIGIIIVIVMLLVLSLLLSSPNIYINHDCGFVRDPNLLSFADELEVYRRINNAEGCVRFEVFTAVTMKNAVFCDVSPCGSC